LNCFYTNFRAGTPPSADSRYRILTDITFLFTFSEIFHYSWCKRAAVSRLLFLHSSKLTADPPDGRHNLRHADGVLTFCKRCFPVSLLPTNCNVIRNDGPSSPAKKYKVVSKISEIQFAPKPSTFRLGQLTLKSIS